MTWKEFKESVEAQGMEDETTVISIRWDGDSEPVVDMDRGDCECEIG